MAVWKLNYDTVDITKSLRFVVKRSNYTTDENYNRIGNEWIGIIETRDVGHKLFRPFAKWDIIAENETEAKEALLKHIETLWTQLNLKTKAVTIEQTQGKKMASKVDQLRELIRSSATPERKLRDYLELFRSAVTPQSYSTYELSEDLILEYWNKFQDMEQSLPLLKVEFKAIYVIVDATLNAHYEYIKTSSMDAWFKLRRILERIQREVSQVISNITYKLHTQKQAAINNHTWTGNDTFGWAILLNGQFQLAFGPLEGKGDPWTAEIKAKVKNQWVTLQYWDIPETNFDQGKSATVQLATNYFNDLTKVCKHVAMLSSQ